MKKLIIILLTLPLIASSCLKDDDDKFDKSASERMKEYLDNTSKVLSAAPNGWVVEYYPSQFQEYGGVRMYMKFDATKNTVVIASEAGAADATEESYYSFGEDYGPTLNFDTFNTLFHYYSKPEGTVGSANVGWGGDYEFIIMSVEADKVVLRGKKSQNTIVLTPASTADWTADFTAYRQAADKMDEMISYQMVIGSRSYLMSRDAISGYRSRHFTINATPAVSVGYIYTPTGIKFYEPVSIDNVSISEMTWQDGEFVDAKTGSKITQIQTDHTFEITTSNVQIRTADVSVKPSDTEVYYVIGSYPSADAQTKSDAKIMNELVAKVSLSDLYQKTATNVPLSLKAETEYIACAFAVTIVNGYIYPTSALSKSAPFTTLQDVPMTPEYEAWLGTWTVESTSSEVSGSQIQLNVTIAENIRNASYLIYGWDISTLAQADYPGNAELNGKELTISSNQNLGAYSNGTAMWYTLCLFDNKMPTALINGTFPAFTCTLKADNKSAAVKSYVGGYSGADGSQGSFEAMSMTVFMAAADGTYYVPVAPGYTAQDFPLGPYTMVKTGDAAQVDMKALRHKDYLVDLKVYSQPTPRRQAL